jgi:hypothetical protein
MSPPAKSRFWRRARLTFRWFRITIWLLLLALVCLLLWLNRHGLPESVRQRVMTELRAQGLDCSFQRLRLHWRGGIVAEGARFQQAATGPNPRLTARELAVHFDLGALARRQLRVRGVVLTGGTLSLPLDASNAPPREAVIEGLHAQVDFLSDQRWQLSALEGHCYGIDFRLSGTLSNAPALLAWKSGDSAAAQQRADLWSRAASYLEQIQFTPPAKLKGRFSGDGRAPETSSARVELTAVRFGSPWAGGRDLEVALDIQPRSNRLAHVEFVLAAFGAQLRWGQAASLKLQGHTDLPFADPQPQNVHLEAQADSLSTLWGRARTCRLDVEAASLSAPGWAEKASAVLALQSVETRWGDAPALDWQGELRLDPARADLAQGSYELRCPHWRSPWLDATNVLLTAQTAQWTTNLWPSSLRTHLEVGQPVFKQTDFAAGLFSALPPAGPGRGLPATTGQSARALPGDSGRAKSARVEANFILPLREEMFLDRTNVSWMTRLEKVRMDGQAELQALELRQMELERVQLAAHWRAPALAVEPLLVRLYGGQITAISRLDLVTGELTGSLASEVDPHRLTPFFTTNASQWRALVQWEKPPQLQADLRMLLPLWTNRPPHWQDEVLPTLCLAGTFRLGPVTIRSIPVTSASGVFSLTNLLWQARQVDLTRPEGALGLSLDSDSRTGRFRLSFHSAIDPKAARPLLATEDGQEALDYFRFTQPPVASGEVVGRWGDWARTSLRGQVALTNLSFRDQAIKSCLVDVVYTNQVLDFFHVRLQREEGLATADQIRVDLRRETVNLTNLQSTVEVGAVAAAIGPHIVKTLQPYQFSQPPKVFFQGVVGIHSRSGLDDARFEVSGGPFQWQNFKLSRVHAQLHWLQDTLAMNHFDGTLHGGEVQGDAGFDMSRPTGMDFRFTVLATNVSAKPFLADQFPTTTNQLEGLLSGRLVITNATTLNDKSWCGYGDVSLRDGVIWDVPIFRFFSPILNGIVPGLGNSRPRHASASFFITNSVMATRDLEVRALAMRMLFDGTVDFEGKVHGKMEAELFRDAPGFGWMISHLLWPVTKVFVYKIGGTLNHPKMDPLYVPKILMLPFHPLRTLKEIFSEDKSGDKGGARPPEEKKYDPGW